MHPGTTPESPRRQQPPTGLYRPDAEHEWHPRRSHRQRHRRKHGKNVAGGRHYVKESRRASPMSEPRSAVLATPIKVLSLNACDGGSKMSFFSDLEKVAQTDRPDIIFLQEAPEEAEIPGYAVVSVANEDADYERMICLRRVDSQWTLAKTDVIESEYCDTPRVCTLHTFSAGKTMLRVASVHLCGGRYDEEVHAWESFEKMKLAKLDMLSSIIKLGPDIVLGDFNSDYFRLPNTIKFLKKSGFSKERAQSWTTLPFTALKKNGYIRVPFETATSVYGGQPDQIFHVPELRLESSTTVDFLSSDSSDHNGLLAQFV